MRLVMQTGSLGETDGLVCPEPGVLLLDHGRVVMAHEEQCLNIGDDIGFVVELVQVLRKFDI